MTVPTVLATTARRSCRRCSASDRPVGEISAAVIVSLPFSVPLFGGQRESHSDRADATSCATPTRRRYGKCSGAYSSLGHGAVGLLLRDVAVRVIRQED